MAKKLIFLWFGLLWLFFGSLAPAHASDDLANYILSRLGAAKSDPWTSKELSAKLRGQGPDLQALGKYLQNQAREINQAPQDAKLQIEGVKAVEFVPHREGQIVDLAASLKILKELEDFDPQTPNSPALVIVTIKPKLKLESLNNLGIKELIARGQTDFSGSSVSRMQNIRVGASRYQGLLIAPGEEFSFNKHLGPIDAKRGFLPELVIKPEGTVPEFGGGLCQVSSTAFRAAFFAGLPITERRNHSYAVRYYEWISDDVPRAVGLDATIYPGSQDLKFVNDTEGTILIWTKVEGKRLYFDFYGTKDGREVVVDGPHPYDRRPHGAVKSKVTRTVSKGEEVQETTFNSRYVSPNLYPKIYEYPPSQTNNQ